MGETTARARVMLGRVRTAERKERLGRGRVHQPGVREGDAAVWDQGGEKESARRRWPCASSAWGQEGGRSQCAQEMAAHEQLVGPGRGEEVHVGERGGGRAAEEQRREERMAVRGQEATRTDRGRVVGGVRAAAGKEPGLAV
jgi:hypothetical protein